MANELDDFLDAQKEQREKKRNEEIKKENELGEKQRTFVPKFQDVMREVIHPAMIKILEKLRNHGNYSKVLHDKSPTYFPNERYEIYPGNGKYFVLSIIGNYDLLKICMDIEYFESVKQEGTYVQRSFKKIEEQYELSDITPALLESLVLKAIKELLPAQS